MEFLVSKSKFKAQALALFRQVEQTGEPVVITDRGTPALIVQRYSRQAPQATDILKGSVLRYDRPLDPVGDTDWETLE